MYAYMRSVRRLASEKITAASDDCSLEAIDRGHQVIELAARLAPCEEHPFLSDTTRELEHRGVALLTPMWIERFLLLLKGFLSHSASTLFWGCILLSASPVIAA